MPTLRLSVVNAQRKPLPDLYDADVTAMNTGATSATAQRVDGTKTLDISGLSANTVYQVRVFPFRHRPVSRFVLMGGGATKRAEIACPIHPDRVRRVVFPDYDDLPDTLRATLDRSVLESTNAVLTPAPGSGAQLFDGLTSLEKAGLLNLFTKMTHTPVAGKQAWDFMTDVYRVRGDRIFGNVVLPFRDAVKTAVTSSAFAEVNGALHTPPPGFRSAGSFKTADHAGNLQLTFFNALEPLPLAFKVDADIDDAAGIGHVFQVLRNFLTNGDTHPYDIHEILTFHQALTPLYQLEA